MNGSDQWYIRRRIVIFTLLLCGVVIVYLMLKGESNPLNQSLVNGAYLLAGSVIGTYVFGATWDDSFRSRSK
ncbi:hypothetical protein [Veronia pacifica]|uniref:Uncharacterized protein n=1 Tax=Veronia pacifica TaxID=1080227 RepID=A0A1C3EE32_9GAMM|nr:hypothetical protein [Veronia pacifica]ODA31512.1 hypothetical protein A8L45_16575 [Veronia pacifica]